MHGVDRWTILGLSWGTTLGLAYAQTYSHRVNALVLGFVTTTSHREVQWITEDVGRIFPQEWDRFANAVPDHLRHLRLVDAYATMLADPDPTEPIASSPIMIGTPPPRGMTSARLRWPDMSPSAVRFAQSAEVRRNVRAV